MVDSREQLYRCDFIAESVHVYAHVRAWDAPEALSAFIAELERDGVAVAGEIRVVPLRGGGAAVTVRYSPGPRPGPRQGPEPPPGG